jgi:hypothetical protein
MREIMALKFEGTMEGLGIHRGKFVFLATFPLGHLLLRQDLPVSAMNDSIGHWRFLSAEFRINSNLSVDYL